MKLKSTEQLDKICKELLEKYETQLEKAVKSERTESVAFWQGKYDAIYELLMIIDSPLWYELHSEDMQ